MQNPPPSAIMGQKRKDVSALTLLYLWYRTYQLAFGLGARLLP